MIKLMSPWMPSPTSLLPYLNQMHRTQQFSNDGPLCRELAARVAQITGFDYVVPVANATQGLELALRAVGIGSGNTVLVPAATFVASGLAIRNVGATPILADVDAESWLLTTSIARGVAKIMKYDAVMPVAAYGMPVDADAWAAFGREFRIPVVIDAAGALTTQKMKAETAGVHIVYSLHATKFIGAGEGGLVVSKLPQFARRVKEMSMFRGDGEPGATNAKLSEYHAAVALASLDNRMEKHRLTLELASEYIRRMPIGFAIQKGMVMDRTLFPVLLPPGITADHAAAHLADHDIESKQWYRPFLHEGRQLDRWLHVGDLKNTEMLIERMIGLPFHLFMTTGNVQTVMNALREL